MENIARALTLLHCLGPSHFESSRTWAAEDIDIATQRVDHLPVLCHFVLKVFKPTADFASRHVHHILGPDASFCRALQDPERLHDLHDGINLPPSHTDPHGTADALAFQTQRAIRHIHIQHSSTICIWCGQRSSSSSSCVH